VALRAHRPREVLLEAGRAAPALRRWLRHAAPLAVLSTGAGR